MSTNEHLYSVTKLVKTSRYPRMRKMRNRTSTLVRLWRVSVVQCAVVYLRTDSTDFKTGPFLLSIGVYYSVYIQNVLDISVLCF